MGERKFFFIIYYEMCVHVCDATKYTFRNWSFAIIFSSNVMDFCETFLYSCDQQLALIRKLAMVKV